MVNGVDQLEAVWAVFMHDKIATLLAGKLQTEKKKEGAFVYTKPCAHTQIRTMNMSSCLLRSALWIEMKGDGSREGCWNRVLL